MSETLQDKLDSLVIGLSFLQLLNLLKDLDRLYFKAVETTEGQRTSRLVQGDKVGNKIVILDYFGELNKKDYLFSVRPNLVGKIVDLLLK